MHQVQDFVTVASGTVNKRLWSGSQDPWGIGSFGSGGPGDTRVNGGHGTRVGTGTRDEPGVCPWQSGQSLHWDSFVSSS